MQRTRKCRKWVVIMGLTAMLMTLLSGCGGNAGNKEKTTAADPASRQYYIFDTVVNIKLYEDPKAEEHLDHIDTMLKTLDQELSRTLETSQLYKVNQEAGKQAVEVSEDTMEVLKRSLNYAQETDGLFDPTVGGLVDLWDIGHEGAHVPAPEDLQRELSLVGYKDVVMDEAKQTVFLKRPGMILDLGGIGKGYAADKIAAYLRGEGVKSALVDLGGSSIIVVGSKPNGDSWTVGLQDPDSSRGTIMGNIRLNDQVINTSGIYERYFIEDGVMYHHILDPRTGAPAQNELKSVTILTDNATDADALSTVVYVMGLEKGMEFVENYNEETQALFITKDNKIYATTGLKDTFKVTDEQYSLVE
ncbi:FAD:protein FMN transferase [Paenibacillus rubinfantis]|uniref:FAD:protein FMN transferase n=1 Tax=Paenibacillus rubinfantis TaxID=1720296 RepID=UPI00073E8A95|nr:FAD:protein FMN transferase [Paenibacillus rubinfantis]